MRKDPTLKRTAQRKEPTLKRSGEMGDRMKKDSGPKRMARQKKLILEDVERG